MVEKGEKESITKGEVSNRCKQTMETIGPWSVVYKTKNTKRNKQDPGKNWQVALAKNATIDVRIKNTRSRFIALEEELIVVNDNDDCSIIMESGKFNVHEDTCNLAESITP